MNSRDQAAFDLYQTYKNEPREVLESLLEEFFNRVSADEYEEQQRRVTEIVSCVIFTSPLPSHSSDLF